MLHDLKLRTKLIGGFGIVLLIVGAVVALNISGLKSVTTGYNEILDGTVHLAERARQINVQILQCRRNEKDFLARLDPGYQQKMATNLALLQDHRQAVTQLAEGCDLPQVVEGLRAHRQGSHGLRRQFRRDRRLLENQGAGAERRPSATSRQQATGVNELNSAMGQIDLATQANAASAEEAASTSEEMAAQATSLQGMVKVLIGIVEGRGSIGAQGSPSAVHGDPTEAWTQPRRTAPRSDATVAQVVQLDEEELVEI